MDRFGLAFMSTQKDAQEQAAQAIRNMNEGSDFNKKYATEFLDAIYSELITPQSSPISKTMTLHVLKELTYNAQVRFFSLLSSHKTLQFLVNQAKTIDPKKNVSEKGLKKFPDSPQIGKQYMKLLMQLTNFWGEKFARGKNNQATKFKRNLIQLKNLGVTLPSNYEIFDPNQYKSRSKKSKQGGTSSNSMLASETPGGAVGSGPKSTGKISTQLRYTKNKINLFIGDLQEAEDADRTQNIINTSHAFFDKQKNKYEPRAAEVEQDDEAVADYFAVQHFLTEEGKFYNKYIPNNDIQSYIAEVRMLNEQTFEKKQPTSRFPAGKPEQTKPLLPSTSPPNAANILQSLTNRLGSSSNPSNQLDNRAIISSIYDRLESRSKSPGVGFKNVGMELQKQKQLARRNPPRRTPSKSPNRSTTNLATSTASNSAKVHPIFDNPPNRFVGSKNYEGQFVMENKDLARVLYNIKKDQGSRRFKISNFRQKNPLFENQHLQVGYKSQAIYESVGGFNHFILLNIFIGNKTEEGIKQFQVQYKADTNQLLYANPRSVDSIIPAGYQNKHDLMITPLSVPYSFMTMHLSYKFNNSQVYTSIVLPNSVLKFVSYMKIGRTDFNNNWKNARKLKTNAFRLCKHLAPDTFSKWIPVLDNITNYSQFSREGSETDLQMFCMAIMLQKYEAVLKINIRPNLDVVLQLGVLDNNQEGADYFKFYLESLELVLKQTEM